jgi:hypothetical protein
MEDGAEYELRSSENGAGFLLRYKTENLTANLSGEDASRFRQDYETIRGEFPDWTADQVLAQLWDQGGYSWLAEQDG